MRGLLGFSDARVSFSALCKRSKGNESAVGIFHNIVANPVELICKNYNFIPASFVTSTNVLIRSLATFNAVVLFKYFNLEVSF